MKLGIHKVPLRLHLKISGKGELREVSSNHSKFHQETET